MNGKKVKELRGIARGLTVGKPYRVYAHKPVAAQPGKPRPTSPTGTVLLGDCTRKFLKNLKRQFKKGNPVVRPKAPPS